VWTSLKHFLQNYWFMIHQNIRQNYAVWFNKYKYNNKVHMKNFSMLRCRSTTWISMLHLADINFGELQKHVDVFYCLPNIKILFHRPGKTRILTPPLYQPLRENYTEEKECCIETEFGWTPKESKDRSSLLRIHYWRRHKNSYWRHPLKYTGQIHEH